MAIDPKRLVNVRFTLRDDRRPDQCGKFAIDMVLSKGKSRTHVFTGKKCTVDSWISGEKLTNDNSINLDLEQLREKTYHTVQKLYFNDKGYSPREIKLAMFPVGPHAANNTPTLRGLYYERLRRKSKGKRAYSAETQRCYYYRWNRIAGFLDYKYGKEDIPVTLLDKGFASEFEDWLLTYEDEEKGFTPLAPSTAVSIHARLKATIRDAISRGIEMVNPYDHFSLHEPPSDPTILTSDELKRVIEVDLDIGTAEIARDYFVFSTFTACRLQDAKAMKSSNLVRDGGKWWLRFDEIQKTDRPNHEIPLMPEALKIIERYKPYNLPGDYLLPRISDQAINRWLKYVAAMADIKKKNLTHNVSRHTCATTLLLDNGAHLEEVQKFMGHRSIKSTMVYAKVTRKRLEEVAYNAISKFEKG